MELKNNNKSNYKSALNMDKDPEFVKLFINFAFKEVMEHVTLDKKTRMIVVLESLIAQQSLNQYSFLLKEALKTDVTPVEIKEVIYQAVPYCGIAKVYDFIEVTNEIFEENNITLPLEGQSTTTPGTRLDKGLEVQKSIFGDVIDQMYEMSPDNQVHFQKFLSDNCFGDYYTRTGLDVKTRELLTFNIILSLGGCEPQLKGHIQGNVNVGNDKDTLLSVVTLLLPYVGYPRTLNALQCLNEIIPEEE